MFLVKWSDFFWFKSFSNPQMVIFTFFKVQVLFFSHMFLEHPIEIKSHDVNCMAEVTRWFDYTANYIIKRDLVRRKDYIIF